MQVRFTVQLPTDAGSVPVIRQLCRATMAQLGVETDCIDDIALAVTEACSNVVRHAHRPSGEFLVLIDLCADLCEIRVIDQGPGFAPDAIEEPDDALFEAGRGIPLMRQLVDDLRFEQGAERGTVVHFQKVLDLTDGSVLASSDTTRP